MEDPERGDLTKTVSHPALENSHCVPRTSKKRVSLKFLYLRETKKQLLAGGVKNGETGKVGHESYTRN